MGNFNFIIITKHDSLIFAPNNVDTEKSDPPGWSDGIIHHIYHFGNSYMVLNDWLTSVRERAREPIIQNHVWVSKMVYMVNDSVTPPTPREGHFQAQEDHKMLNFYVATYIQSIWTKSTLRCATRHAPLRVCAGAGGRDIQVEVKKCSSSCLLLPYQWSCFFIVILAVERTLYNS